jgi:hypothetical protein
MSNTHDSPIEVKSALTAKIGCIWAEGPTKIFSSVIVG